MLVKLNATASVGLIMCLCVRKGLVSAQFSPPPPSPSIYLWGPYMPVRVWMQVWEWQLHCVMELTCTSWAEARDRFAEISRWHFWSVREESVWLITLIKQHCIVVRITLLKSTRIIPGNRPVESWITPVLIVVPGNLTKVTLQRVLREENRKPAPLSLCLWNLHMFTGLLKPLLKTYTAWTLPKPLFKSLKYPTGRQKLAEVVCGVVMTSTFSYSVQSGRHRGKKHCEMSESIQVLLVWITRDILALLSLFTIAKILTVSLSQE